MIDKDRKRQRALIFIRVLSLCQLAFCPLLFTLGGVGQSLHGDSDGGVTYYAGAYVAAVLVVFPSVNGIVIYHQGLRCFSTTTAAIKLGCLLPTYCVFMALSSLGYIISTIITGIAGLCSAGGCVYKQNESRNNGMATTILVILLLLLATNFVGMVLVCLSEKYFGLTLFKRGQRRIADTSSPRRPPTRQESVVISRTTTPHPNAHPQIIHNLQVQNQVLQQQLLFNQQQQLNLLQGPPQVHFAAGSGDVEPSEYPEQQRHRKRRRHRGHRTAPEPPARTDGYTLPPIQGARPQPPIPPPYQQDNLAPPPYTP